MKKIIYLDHHEKSITGGHKYNDAFEEYLVKFSGLKIQATAACANKYKGWRKIFSPFMELKNIKLFKDSAFVLFGDTSFKHHFLLAMFNKWITKSKSVIIIHHYIFNGQTSLSEKIYNWLFCKYISYMDSIIVPSQHTLDVVKSLFPDKSIYYIPIPFERKFLKSESYETGNFLYVGTIEERKGLSYLIDAISLLDDKLKINLNIVGKITDETYFNKLKNKIHELKLESNIHFWGRLSNEELETCYKKAEIFTFPSLMEGYGIVLIEAFNNGIPIICFNNTAMPYTVKDGFNGFLANNENAQDLASKIKLLYNNKKLREKLQEGIKETIMNIKTKDDFEKAIRFFYQDFVKDQI